MDDDLKTAVHRHGGPADDAAVRRGERLVPEAHAEHRDVHRVRQHVRADPDVLRSVGRARPGR